MLRGLARIFAIGAVVRDCGSPGDTAKVLNATFVPDAPLPGDVVSTTFAYALSKDITSGTAIYSLTLNGIPYTTTSDLCTQTTCPKVAGTYVERSNSTYPQISGKLVSKIQWYDQDTTEVLCVEYTTRTMRSRDEL